MLALTGSYYNSTTPYSRGVTEKHLGTSNTLKFESNGLQQQKNTWTSFLVIQEQGPSMHKLAKTDDFLFSAVVNAGYLSSLPISLNYT